MSSTIHRESYINQLKNLELIINESNRRIIDDSNDSFVKDNANFFTKSFLVTMCAYLESYLKDVLELVINESNAKLDIAKIPYNLIRWSKDFDKELKDGDVKYGEHFRLTITKRELDNYISGNPQRTERLFRNFGINLRNDEIFISQKELLRSIIDKRNKILHHNDEASDISNNDLINNLKLLLNYIKNIDHLIYKHLNQ